MLQSQSFRVAKMQLKSAWSPDIAISRDPGSGGRFIAKKIATKLGWKLFDKALMFKLSEELGIKTAELEHIDEHGRTWFADTFHSIFNPAYVFFRPINVFELESLPPLLLELRTPLNMMASAPS
ncbi:MAG: Cytidylate kinase [Microgenomates group bacterium GW2011_GWF1_46_12]|nr:MAG: Cytidylate kinase [Microgenomates group bacterium GW2011_GWF1_46_12]